MKIFTWNSITKKAYITALILCIYSFNSMSQNNIPTIDNIVFNDGSIKGGKLKLNNSQGLVFNGKVKLCDRINSKDCISYQISDINHITQAPPELIVQQLKEFNGNNISKKYQKILDNSEDPDEFKIETYVNHYKVIYNENEEKGDLAKLKYQGKNADFYYYAKPGKNGGKTCLTKPNSKIIIFSFNSTATSNKFSLKQLTDYFKDCDLFTTKSTEKNAHKKFKIKYFYKLTDKCVK